MSRLHAAYLKIQIKLPSFEFTGKATLQEGDTKEFYKQYCQNNVQYGDVGRTMEQWVFKTLGGRKEDSFKELIDEQRQEFKDFVEGIEKENASFRKDYPEFLGLLPQSDSQTDIKKYSQTLEEVEAMFERDIGDGKEWSGMDDYRKAIELGPVELNNLEPPNIIEKIWGLVRQKPIFDNLEWEIEDFLQLRQHPIYPNREQFNYEKVVGIYLMLNMVGYRADRKLHNEKRYTAAMSDGQHASMATFCDHLLSRDANFVHKTRAIYEFLNVNTLVYMVNVESRGSVSNT